MVCYKVTVFAVKKQKMWCNIHHHYVNEVHILVELYENVAGGKTIEEDFQLT